MSNSSPALQTPQELTKIINLNENPAASEKPNERPATNINNEAGRTVEHSRRNRHEQSNSRTVSIREYLRELFQGGSYSFTRRDVLSLICLEMVVYAIGTVTCLLQLSHVEHVWTIHDADPTRFFCRALICAGIGLFSGFVCMIPFNKSSPILMYAPAFILIACGEYGVFNAGAAWFYPALFILGLGGAVVVKSVNSNIQALVESEVGARVLSFKRMALSATVVTTLLVLAESSISADHFYKITVWLPRLLFLSLPFIFVLSWILDISIHTKNEIGNIQEFPDCLHRFGYCLLRGIARSMCRLLFHSESVNSRNVPESGGVVLAANHASFIDPILLACGTNRVIQYIMYSSYYRSWAHPIFRFLRCIPVDEKDQIAALRAGVRSLKLGACIGIFPEGEVSADGALHPPHRGALFLAQRSGAPVVSAAIKGDFQALPRNRWIPHAKKVTVIFGTPFTIDSTLSKEGTAGLTDQLMSDLSLKLELSPSAKIADNGV